MKLVRSGRPYFHTFHRAWGKCVGLPLYDKRKWKDLEDEANAADAAGATEGQRASLIAKIEVLLVRQGAPIDPEPSEGEARSDACYELAEKFVASNVLIGALVTAGSPADIRKALVPIVHDAMLCAVVSMTKPTP